MTRNGLHGRDRPMSPNCTTAQLRSSARRLFVGLCVFAHLAATIGFPIRQPVETVPTAATFPCQQRRCGCNSADNCWRSCCCYSAQEKLVWAKEHGVTPPEYAIAAAEEEALAQRSCCRQDLATNIALDQSDDSPGGCCKSSPVSESKVSSAPESDWDWVIGIQARKCQGLSSSWLVSGAVVIPPLVETPDDTAPPLWWSGFPVICLQGTLPPPDVPPPQRFGGNYSAAS